MAYRYTGGATARHPEAYPNEWTGPNEQILSSALDIQLYANLRPPPDYCYPPDSRHVEGFASKKLRYFFEDLGPYWYT